MQANSNCYCTSVVIKVPGIQGTGIIWETLTDEEKQDISDKAITPIREYVEDSKTIIKDCETNVLSMKESTKSYMESAQLANQESQNLSQSTQQEISNIGLSWQNNIVSEGNTQIAYLKNIVNLEEGLLGVTCFELTWEVSEHIPEESEITLPAQMYYIPYRNHLRVNWNGMELQRDVSFSEIGEKDTRSTKLRFLMPLEEGDSITVWTVPLGRGNTDELVSRIKALEDAFAELSRVVVYRE